jgi:pimeloyl-ACP methyl ester carboxylesterase
MISSDEPNVFAPSIEIRRTNLPLSRLRALVAQMCLGILVLTSAAMVLESVLEHRDRARLSRNDTFGSIGNRRVRYRLLGAEKSGPPIVLVPGLFGYIEQWEKVQRSLSQWAPVLTYDRGGMGFSDSTDAHDAESEANELAAVVQASGAHAPFVVVSYSSSAFVAQIFAARHPEMVKGQVFIDPMVPLASAPRPYWRILGRTAVPATAKALVGYLRLRHWIDQPRDSTTASDEKEQAIQVSAHFWLALTMDVFALDRSATEVRAVPASGSVPVGLLSASDPAPRSSPARAAQRALVANSVRGTFQSLPDVDHTSLLSDPVGVDAVVSLVHQIYDEAR